MCDQTKELQTLDGSMSNDDKWIISSSGQYMFVRFAIDVIDLDEYWMDYEYLLSLSSPGFSANIHFGK